MPRPFLIIAAIVMAITANSASHAAGITDTVQELYQMCKDSPGSSRATYCLAYISGVGDQLNAVGQIANLKKGETRAAFLNVGICGDNTRVTYGAMIQAFKNWAEAHPKNWSWDRLVGVVVALKATWPCKVE